jgi:hypothetical protein
MLHLRCEDHGRKTMIVVRCCGLHWSDLMRWTFVTKETLMELRPETARGLL